MDVTISNGGLDCSLYKNERTLYEKLLFFNRIIETINDAIDEEDLRENMKLLFSERLSNYLKGDKQYFSYGFTDTTMEVRQADNPNILITVKF